MNLADVASGPYGRMALAGVTAVLAAAVLTPAARWAAAHWGIVSKPNARSVHGKPVPYLGGLGILGGLLVGMLWIPEVSPAVVGLLSGAVLIGVMGALDDAYGLPWQLRLLLQAGAGALVWWLGVRIEYISPPFTTDNIVFGAWSAPITILWMVAVMNAMNFVDGLDGLAGGIGAIAGLAFLAIAVMWVVADGASTETGQHYTHMAIMAAVLVGGCIGFLFYNFHPASVFMGDCGSMSIGFWLAGLAVLGAFKSTLLYLCPIVLLGLPLSDTAWAVIRRLRQGQSPMTPDRGHIHHRVLDRVQRQRATVLL
ncbi:MAG: undecaprenyl/decaprenyl-phosphate alpha-N-acetylglucosaminyl 1-phosphate transferase, partial [Armatimonadia bacterium]|nr:undecaprenyl/decaprenyl-phosphate alpha-N-acetylglucosaminyl 1-phosphate transferase [Armatimonadia bacterium]